MVEFWENTASLKNQVESILVELIGEGTHSEDSNPTRQVSELQN